MVVLAWHGWPCCLLVQAWFFSISHSFPWFFLIYSKPLYWSMISRMLLHYSLRSDWLWWLCMNWMNMTNWRELSYIVVWYKMIKELLGGTKIGKSWSQVYDPFRHPSKLLGGSSLWNWYDFLLGCTMLVNKLKTPYELSWGTAWKN